MASSKEVLSRATEFLWTHARLLERRLFERTFASGSADAVVRAIAAYRNRDGGLGHALEPDLRAPTSQPIFVDYGLSTLREASAPAGDLADAACSFLASIARDDGAVPYVLPDALRYARADHWKGDFALAPSLHATAGLAARLHACGARHEWLDRATAWCFGQIAGHPAYTGHRMLNVLDLLANAPDGERAASLWRHATARLGEAGIVTTAIPMTEYGLTPLRFAPSPDAPARPLFPARLVEDHLDALLAQQQDDGGWPIFWDPPGAAAVSEWRAKWTLDALSTLRAYGRV